MATVFNTSHRVKTDAVSDEERLSYNLEDGAIVTTSTGVYVVQGGEWKKIQMIGKGTGLGWTRYDDDEYVSGSELVLSNGVEVILPNNGGSIYRSYDGIDYYDPTTQKVLGDNANDVYMFTVVFKAAAANANTTFLRVQLDSVNGTPYERVGIDFNFSKGNDVMHEFHQVFQYYITPDFITSGSEWRIESIGGTAEVWDIIFFIQKTQSYA